MIGNLRNVIAGVLFLIFLVWLLREISPEVLPYLQAWSLRLPSYKIFGGGRDRYHLATRYFLKIEREFQKRGFKRDLNQTPLHFFDRVCQALPDVSGDCQRFLVLYYSSRFGISTPTDSWSDELRDITASLLKATRNLT